jgi:hypothetical protein
MPERSQSDEVLCHTMRRYSTHDTCIDSCIFDRFTDSEPIYDRPHHPHLISRHTIESSLFELDPTEYIPPSDDDDDFELFYSDEMYYFFGEK